MLKINRKNYWTTLVPIFNKAVKLYENPYDQRDIIRKDNSSKAGVYGWVNNINGKYYIASVDPLYLRLSDYYQKWYLIKRINLPIVRAFIKYGLNNFSLVICRIYKFR